MSVMMTRPQSSEEGEAAASQHEKPNRKSKLPSERVVLLLLWALLAAALIVIYRLAFDKIRTNKTLQTLKEENEALRRNISDHVWLKLDGNWEKHGDKCYYFSNFYLPWTESRRSCEALGADLVKIDSREEQEFLQRTFRNLTWVLDLEGFWIGLTDSEVEGNWTWVDGSPLDTRMNFWFKGQPNNYKGFFLQGEDCALILKRRGAKDLNSWNDHTCSAAHKSICEKPSETGLSSSVCG